MIVCSKPYECKHYPTGVVCAICENGERFCPRTMTRADRIRSMTDEELARWIADELIEPGYYEGDTCYKLWLDWLRQEAGE